MSRKGEKLLERARNSKAGWKARELVTLYEEFGFTIREGKGSHKVVTHPDYDDLGGVISVHPSKEVGKGYVDSALKDIEELLERQKEQEEEEPAEDTEEEEPAEDTEDE
jgi:predicted RNA binding protein YcfA (HicA-like mRNA interferase family)